MATIDLITTRDKRNAMRDRVESELFAALRKIVLRQESAIVREAEAILRLSPAKAFKRLARFDVPHRDLMQRTLARYLIDAMNESESITEKGILEEQGEVERFIKKRGRTAFITETLMEYTSKDYAAQYSAWSKSLTTERYAATVKTASGVIRNAIDGGWGLKPYYEYRQMMNDGSSRPASASKKHWSDVKRVEETPGVINELRKAFEGQGLSSYRLEAIARTEMTRATNQGTINTGRKSPFVKGFEFIGVQDNRQSFICAQLTGAIFDKHDPRIINYTPPLHVNCRSELIEVMVSSDKVANFDTKKTKILGREFRLADLPHEFGKGTIQPNTVPQARQLFNPSKSSALKAKYGIHDNGFPVRSAEDYRKAFVAGQDHWDWRKVNPPTIKKKPTPEAQVDLADSVKNELRRVLETTDNDEFNAIALDRLKDAPKDLRKFIAKAPSGLKVTTQKDGESWCDGSKPGRINIGDASLMTPRVVLHELGHYLYNNLVIKNGEAGLKRYAAWLDKGGVFDRAGKMLSRQGKKNKARLQQVANDLNSTLRIGYDKKLAKELNVRLKAIQDEMKVVQNRQDELRGSTDSLEHIKAGVEFRSNDERLKVLVHEELDVLLKRRSNGKRDTNLRDFYGSVSHLRVGAGHTSHYYKQRYDGYQHESFANLVELYSRKDRMAWNHIKATLPELASDFVDIMRTAKEPTL